MIKTKPKKEHELTRWLRRVRITKTKMAADMMVATSTITRNTKKGNLVSDKMIAKYKKYGVPETIINKMMKQGR